jgi:hypothetical protein
MRLPWGQSNGTYLKTDLYAILCSAGKKTAARIAEKEEQDMNSDFWQIILVTVSAAVGAWAHIKLRSTFSKYAKVPCSNGITGWKAAAQLLKINNINDVKIGPIAGSLTDHYSHTAEVKQIALSEPVYNVSSIAAVGVPRMKPGTPSSTPPNTRACRFAPRCAGFPESHPNSAPIL